MNGLRIRLGMGASCILLVHAAALAQTGPAAEGQDPLYPLSVRLRAEESRTKVFDYKKVEGVAAPKNPTAIVPVGEQAWHAHITALPRVFRLAGEEGAIPDGELELSVSAATIELSRGFWRAVVEHSLVLRADGIELGRWKVREDEPIASAEAPALPLAFQRAAEGAARKFAEIELEKNASVAAWMRKRGVNLAEVASVRNPPRAEYATFLDLGGGLMDGDVLVAVRAGFAGPGYLVQLAAGKWSSLYAPSARSGYSDVQASTTSIGLDLAGRLQSGRWEVRAGGGGHLLHGHADQTYPVDTTLFPGSPVGRTSFPFNQLVPSVFAAVQYAGGPGPLGARLRFGLEVRGYLGPSLKFAEYGESSVAGASLNFFLGAELPVRRQTTRSGPR